MSVCDLSYLFKFFFKVQRDKTLHLHFLSKNWFKRTHIQSSSDVTLASRVWTNGEYFLPVRNSRASKLSHEARIKMRLNCFLPSIAFRVTNTLLQVNGKLAWKVLNETVPLVTTKRCQEPVLDIFTWFYFDQTTKHLIWLIILKLIISTTSNNWKATLSKI